MKLSSRLFIRISNLITIKEAILYLVFYIYIHQALLGTLIYYLIKFSKLKEDSTFHYNIPIIQMRKLRLKDLPRI